MRRLWLPTLLISAACASTPVTRHNVAASLSAADRVRNDGCYDCLLEARDRYQAAAVGPNRLRALMRAFETELLVALREREFAIDNAAALARARALAAQLPPAFNADAHVDVVASIPHRGAGWSRRDVAAFRTEHGVTPEMLAERAAWVRAGELAPAVRDYIARSLECAAAPATAVSGAAPPGSRAADLTPLLRYREATCRAIDPQALVSLRQIEPRFVEASYYIGERAVVSIAEPGAANPHQLVEDVGRRFPDSSMVAFLAARLEQVVGDCQSALTAFDRLLTLAPAHEDGWLGRVMCLTDLQRHGEGVRAATHMIDQAFDNAEDARFWRAWNLHLLGDLPPARADIDHVRQRRQNAGILALAGAIEHDQQEFDLAERDLRGAQRMGSNKVCRAFWYLGSVLAKRQALAEAIQTYRSSMTCYAEEAASRERLIETELANPAVDAEFRRVQTARLREEASLQRHQQYASALNMAYIHVARLEPANAAPLIEIAANDPQLVNDVAALRAAIGRMMGTGISPRP